MHLLVMADYPSKFVKEAYLLWVKENNKIPTPSDIVKRIEHIAHKNWQESSEYSEYQKAFYKKFGIIHQIYNPEP